MIFRKLNADNSPFLVIEKISYSFINQIKSPIHISTL
jgi:hypothetical protein